MPEEDLQRFRSHPRIWEDGEEAPSTVGGDDRPAANEAPHAEEARPVHPLNVSWPLTSFANTIQNVCCISFMMGFLFCLNLALVVLLRDPVWMRLNVYFILLVSFHLLEFLTTAIFNPSRVTVDSFLLNNGASYWFAQAFCVLEYVTREVYLSTLPSAKWWNNPTTTTIGISLLMIGQMIRSVSMITAANSFNHRVSTHPKKQDDHVLVTHGIYRFLRHPSYFGFFWWSIGIQIFLHNWLSTLLFSFVLWTFFHARIRHEEYHLVKFFKQDYIQYRSNTPTYIPFIK